MKTIRYLIVISLVATAVIVFSQNKKTAKANKIKAATVWQTDMENGKTTTYKDSYEEFDKNGNTVQEIEYKKDGSVKKKKTAVYDQFQNVIEETVYDAGKKTNYMKKYKYNAYNDVTEETEFEGSGALVRKTVFTYNNQGDVLTETVTDPAGKVIKKIVYQYAAKKLKSGKQTYNTDNTLVSTKKWSYEYY